MTRLLATEKFLAAPPPDARKGDALVARIAFLSACVLLPVILCAAQGAKVKTDGKGHPDFSGSWTLDKSKSDFGPFRDSPVVKADVALVIAHGDPALKMTRTMKREGRELTQELNYYTDGRGETNPSTLGRVGLRSETRWDGRKIVARSTLKRKTPDGGALEIESTEKWELSGDGQTLTQTSVINAPSGAQTLKQVYRRAP
jgi:hypothetical protein